MNYTFDTDSRYGEFHNFKEGNCVISIRKVSDEVFSLDDFRCNANHFKGEGRKLLLYVLQQIKEKNKQVKQIILSAVPEITFDKSDNLEKMRIKKALAKENLKKYYTELGFNADTNSDDEDDMEGNIDDIISKISRRSGGGGRTSKKTGRGRSKKTGGRKMYKKTYKKRNNK
jgi:hypothetical protein